MRISDWSSDVCSSDLGADPRTLHQRRLVLRRLQGDPGLGLVLRLDHRQRCTPRPQRGLHPRALLPGPGDRREGRRAAPGTSLGVEMVRIDRLALRDARSEEHTSELQSLMRISYAVFCLKKKKKKQARR